jgi:hypothetical protein
LSIKELRDGVATSRAEIRLLEHELRKEKKKNKRLQEAINAAIRRTGWDVSKKVERDRSTLEPKSPILYLIDATISL